MHQQKVWCPSTLTTGLCVCKATAGEKKTKKIPVADNGGNFILIFLIPAQPFTALGQPAQDSLGTLVAAGQLSSFAPEVLYPCWYQPPPFNAKPATEMAFLA